MYKIVFDIKKATRLQVQQFMTTHIERTQLPANCDPTRTHLNRDLIPHPKGIDRTQAIINRIEHTGVTVRKNSVVALQVMLSATHEGMKELENQGKLDRWIDDNLKFLCDTYGEENVAAATLHLDEFTPHIHATVVPIVTGGRRSKNQTKPNKRERELEEKRELKALQKHLKNGGTHENFIAGKTKKRRYTKKDANAYRLCADDLFTSEKLYQTRKKYHSEIGEKYGFDYGEDYMRAREPFKNAKKHRTTQQYYANLKQEIPELEYQHELLELSIIKKEDEIEKLNKEVMLRFNLIEKIQAIELEMIDVPQGTFDGANKKHKFSFFDRLELWFGNYIKLNDFILPNTGNFVTTVFATFDKITKLLDIKSKQPSLTQEQQKENRQTGMEVLRQSRGLKR